jgi:hypothetical protein
MFVFRLSDSPLIFLWKGDRQFAGIDVHYPQSAIRIPHWLGV